MGRDEEVKSLKGANYEKIDTEKAFKKRFPEGVALVVCKNREDRLNITPGCWFMLFNSHPKMWAIGLANKHYSTKIIIV